MYCANKVEYSIAFNSLKMTNKNNTGSQIVLGDEFPQGGEGVQGPAVALQGKALLSSCKRK